MNKWEVVGVIPKENYLLYLKFANGKKKVFDCKTLFDKPVFNKLKDVNYFNKVQLGYFSVVWNNELDIDPECLYKRSRRLKWGEKYE
jgi:hypothetical protein